MTQRQGRIIDKSILSAKASDGRTFSIGDEIYFGESDEPTSKIIGFGINKGVANSHSITYAVFENEEWGEHNIEETDMLKVN